MNKHRNSQKRIVFEDAIYFITSKTHESFPYFWEPVFCDLFVENLKVCKRLKGFKLYGWVLPPDHFHLLVQPNDEYDISEIMKSLKENVSCSINRIMLPTEGGTTSSRLRRVYLGKYDIIQFQKQFHQKYPSNHSFPQFAWQSSFHDHFIRNQKDFDHHLRYLIYNPQKHGLPVGWRHVSTNPDYTGLTDCIV